MGEHETPQAWQRLEELLDEALELAPTQRASYLESLSGKDAEYRSRLETLLLSSPRASELFEQPLLKSSLNNLKPGDQIGVYRIVRALGKGGMGEVFEAQRDDGMFDMKVAIKLLLPGRDHANLVERFQVEQQILADLIHPNIARLHDGGTIGSGRPYLVMELVEGQRLDTYSDTHHLPIRRRLRLFRQVCDAVNFAHRHSVIHRDIKPSNILVDTQGQVKLLDFGIAKVLDGAGGAEKGQPRTPTPWCTNPDSQPRTPQYASPEQFECASVTTSTDVFSLGVVLYELITGHPYRKEIGLGTPEDSTEKPSLVVQQTIEAKSKIITLKSVSEPRNIAPHRLPGLLSGDLDSIVLRALERQPEHRYSTVEKLADDLDRHLAGLPVEARGHEPLHRVIRLASYYRRHIATVAFCTALLVFGSLGLYREHQTNLRQERTVAMTDFALGLFQVTEPLASTNRDIPVQDFLAESIENLKPTSEQSPLIGLIGSFYVGLGEYDKARPLLRKALQRVDREHPLWIYFHHDLYLVESIMPSNEQTTDSGSSFDPHSTPFPLDSNGDDSWPNGEPLTVGGNGDGRLPPDDFDSPSFNQFLSNRAVGLYQQGKFRESIGLYKEALAMAIRLGSPAETIETIQQNLATSYERLGKPEEAEPLLRQVLAERRARLGDDSLELVNPLNLLSILLQSSGDAESLRQAEGFAQRALDIEERSSADASSMILATLATAKRMPLWLLSNRSEEHQFERRAIILESKALYERALRLEEEAEEPSLKGIATIQLGLSVLAQEDPQDQEQLSTAEELAREARDTLLECCYDPGHWRIAEAESVLGGALLGLGNLEEAAPLLERSFSVLVATRGPKARPTVEAERRLDRFSGIID